jgi:hypothetical protein
MIIYIILIILIILICVLLYFQRNTFINTNNKFKYTAVIVEPRKHKALKYVLNNFLENLNDDWHVLIMHGNLNEEYINDIIKNDLIKYKYRIFTHNLKIDNLTIEQYNKLLTSLDFYYLIPTEIFLVFQTDTIICSKFKDNIYKFLKYDYVGAPWKDGGVGNGGLSLRRKSKMIEIIKKCPYVSINKDLYFSFPEDLYFSYPCKNVSIYKPPDNDATEFSIEHVYSQNSFGIHKAYAYLNNEELNEVKSYCHEISQLSELNN